MPQELQGSCPFPTSVDRSHEYELVSTLFDAVKADQRNIGGTLYAAQQANLRNYLWLSSLLITAAIAFLINTGLGNAIFSFLRAEVPQSLTLMISIVGTIGTFVFSIWAFTFAVGAGSGTLRRESTARLFGEMQRFARERDAALEIMKKSRPYSWAEWEKVEFLEMALKDECEDLETLKAETELRGKRLRLIGKLLLSAISSGVVATLSYGFYLL